MNEHCSGWMRMGAMVMKRIIKWILERKVRKARKNFYKQLKLLRDDKVDFSKVLVLGITGELKGESKCRKNGKG